MGSKVAQSCTILRWEIRTLDIKEAEDGLIAFPSKTKVTHMNKVASSTLLFLVTPQLSYMSHLVSKKLPGPVIRGQSESGVHNQKLDSTLMEERVAGLSAHNIDALSMSECLCCLFPNLLDL